MPKKYQVIIKLLQQKKVNNISFSATVSQAFFDAKKNSTHDDCLLVFGSFHTVAAVKHII